MQPGIVHYLKGTALFLSQIIHFLMIGNNSDYDLINGQFNDENIIQIYSHLLVTWGIRKLCS